MKVLENLQSGSLVAKVTNDGKEPRKVLRDLANKAGMRTKSTANLRLLIELPAGEERPINVDTPTGIERVPAVMAVIPDFLKDLQYTAQINISEGYGLLHDGSPVAYIICSPQGERLKPYWVDDDNIDNQAWFSLHNFVQVVLTINGSVEIIYWTVVRDDGQIGIAASTLFTGKLGRNLPETYLEAIKAAAKKLQLLRTNDPEATAAQFTADHMPMPHYQPA